MSASDSFVAQGLVCTEQSPTPVALPHADVNFVVHFEKSGEPPFLMAFATAPHSQETFAGRLRDPPKTDGAAG